MMTMTASQGASTTGEAWRGLLAAPPETVGVALQKAAEHGDLDSLRSALAAGLATTGPSDEALIDRFYTVAQALSTSPNLTQPHRQARGHEILLHWGAALKSQGLLQLALCTFPLHLVRASHFSAVEVLIGLGADPYGLVEVTPRMHRLKGVPGINAAGELFAYFSPGSGDTIPLVKTLFSDVPPGSGLSAAFPRRVVAPAALAGVGNDRASLPEFAAAMNFTDVFEWCISRLDTAAQRELRLRLGQMLLKVLGVFEGEDGVLRKEPKSSITATTLDRRTALYLIAHGAEFESGRTLWAQVLEILRFSMPFAQDLAAGQVFQFTISKITQWQALAALIHAGAVDLEARFDGGFGMLHFAAQFSNKIAVRNLLELGARPIPPETVWFANEDHSDNDEILNMLRVARLQEVVVAAARRAACSAAADGFCF
jgi:hypothetical protein